MSDNINKKAYDANKVEQKIQEKILEIQEGFMRWDVDTAVRMRCKMSGLAEALEIVKSGGVDNGHEWKH